MQPIARDNIRLAASVLLLRDSADGPQVFMMKRPGRGDFPDLHVFPGGKVDEDDFAPELLDDLDDGHANRLLGLNAGAVRYWVTAIRECFEECGVLLARRDGRLLELKDAAEIERFDSYRQRLIDVDMSMAELCREENLTLAADHLLYFSHWLTPAVVPRRFDTRFFMARMPAAQKTAAHHWETAGSEWVVPKQALAAHTAGKWQMISPTLTSLKSIAGYDSVAEAFNAVQHQLHLPKLTDELRRQGMQPIR
jgi:8-oxo-dGTP pyrophosphatase MutT (NUDIX family)